jgi:hypothetical protein
MSFGSAGYTDTFSGDFGSFLASKLKKGYDELRGKKKPRKIKAKKLLGRKKKETADVDKAEKLKETVKPAETTAGLDQKLQPPAEEPKKDVEREAVETVQGKGIFDGLVKSLQGLRAANASIRERLAELLKAKDKQSSALAVVAQKNYDDEVIDVEYVVVEQKRLKEAQEDETIDVTGSSAIVKKEEEKKRGPLAGFLGKITSVLGGVGKAIGGVLRNPLAIASLIGGGLLLGDIFGNSAKAADGSVTIGGDEVGALENFFGVLDGEDFEMPGEQTSGSAGYEESLDPSDPSLNPFDPQAPPEQQIASAEPTATAAAPPSGAANKDLAALAAISALESGSKQGQADVAQSIYNRLGDKRYGKSIFDVVTRDKQYQPAFTDPTASSGAGTKTSTEWKNIQDEASAVTAMQSYYRKRGINKSREEVTQQYRSALGAIQDPTLQASARRHVGGRTEFLSSGSRVKGSDVVWRGGGSDNKFFAEYGSGNQLARGAVAPPGNLFKTTDGYQPPGRTPSSLEVLADRVDQAAPNIIFIPNTDMGIPIPSAGAAVRGAQQILEDPLESLKQLRLWGGD